MEPPARRIESTRPKQTVHSCRSLAGYTRPRSSTFGRSCTTFAGLDGPSGWGAEEGDALGNRELHVLDLDRRQVHVVDQVIEAEQVGYGGLLDHASLDERVKRNNGNQGAERVAVTRATLSRERTAGPLKNRRLLPPLFLVDQELGSGIGYASGTSRKRSPWLRSSTRSRSY
jgi:hypothetical protein